jgi:MFS family permease
MAPRQDPTHATRVRDAAPDPGRLRWAMLALLFVCRTSLGFQFQAMGSTAPRVAAEFGLNLAETGTLIGLFMLPGLFLALPSGYAGRHVSDRRLLAIGLLVMGLGGVLAALAAGFGWLALARIVSGIGFAVGTVYFSKMVADWFAGRELATAMGMLVVSWPLGIAIGQIAHDWMMNAHHWRLAFAVAAAYCAGAGCALWVGYRAAPGAAAPRAAAGQGGLPGRELSLTLLAAAAWGFFNAGYLVFLSFAPHALQAGGLPAREAIPVVSAASLLMMISIPLCGHLADRTGRHDAFLYGCSAVAVLCMLAVPDPGLGVAACVVFGLIGLGPAGVIMSLTGQAMSPARRAFGMGLFSTGYYAITAPAPAIAGWLVDTSGRPRDALALAAFCFAVPIAANLAFRILHARPR